MANLTLAQWHRKLSRWARRAPKSLKQELEGATRLVKRTSQRKHLSGPRMPVGVTSLKLPTIDSKGSLRNSLRTRVQVRGSEISAQVEARHGLAHILHEGGTVTAPARNPFVFAIGGRMVVTRRVRMPARRFLAAARESKRRAILKGLSKRMVRSYEQS